jgi:hypothetical protein
VVKELFTNEHKLYHLAFAESNVDCLWDRVKFSDGSTCSSANGGLVLVSDCGESITTVSLCPPTRVCRICLRLGLNLS